MSTKIMEPSVVDLGYRIVGVILIFVSLFLISANQPSQIFTITELGWEYSVMFVGLAFIIIPMRDEIRYYLK